MFYPVVEPSLLRGPPSACSLEYINRGFVAGSSMTWMKRRDTLRWDRILQRSKLNNPVAAVPPAVSQQRGVALEEVEGVHTLFITEDPSPSLN